MKKKFASNAERQKAYRARHRNAIGTVTPICETSPAVTVPPGASKAHYWTYPAVGDGRARVLVVGSQEQLDAARAEPDALKDVVAIVMF